MSERDREYWPLFLYFILHIKKQNLFLFPADWGKQAHIPSKEEAQVLCQEQTIEAAMTTLFWLGSCRRGCSSTHTSAFLPFTPPLQNIQDFHTTLCSTSEEPGNAAYWVLWRNTHLIWIEMTKGTCLMQSLLPCQIAHSPSSAQSVSGGAGGRGGIAHSFLPTSTTLKKNKKRNKSSRPCLLSGAQQSPLRGGYNRRFGDHFHNNRC